MFLRKRKKTCTKYIEKGADVVVVFFPNIFLLMHKSVGLELHLPLHSLVDR